MVIKGQQVKLSSNLGSNSVFGGVEANSIYVVFADDNIVYIHDIWYRMRMFGWAIVDKS